MTLFITLIAIAQSFAISLGVGSSTLAIINFFAAIADGTIDETERRMMGIVYVVLRIAMIAILVTTIVLHGAAVLAGGMTALSSIGASQLIVIGILFINAVLMSKHVVPSTIGPGLQAGSWYTLGILIALQGQGMTDFTTWQFFLAYLAWLALAIAIVNGIMAYMRTKKPAGT